MQGPLRKLSHVFIFHLLSSHHDLGDEAVGGRHEGRDGDRRSWLMLELAQEVVGRCQQFNRLKLAVQSLEIKLSLAVARTHFSSNCSLAPLGIIALRSTAPRGKGEYAFSREVKILQILVYGKYKRALSWRRAIRVGQVADRVRVPCIACVTRTSGGRYDALCRVWARAWKGRLTGVAMERLRRFVRGEFVEGEEK